MIDVALDELVVTDRVADGGQGSVFRLSDGTLLKLYHAGIAVLAAELGRLIDQPVRQRLGASAAWPTGRVFHGGRCVGLLMPEAPARFATTLAGRSRLLELQFLLYPRQSPWAAVPVPDATARHRLAVGYARLFDLLHTGGVVVGDVSMRNLLWTLAGGPAVFAIDCDGFRVAGRPPAVRPASTAGWGDPSCPHEVTLDSDRYKLALLTLRLLLGNHTVTPADVCAKPLLRAACTPAVAALAALATCPGSRPAAAHWVAALTGDAVPGGGRIAFSCFPLPVERGTGKTVSMPIARAQDGNRR